MTTIVSSVIKGKPIPALWGNDTGEHVIYIGTFSKSIAPSLRISFMVLPHSLMERYHSSCGFYACTVPRNSQEVLCHFMEEGHFERHLNRMRNNYKNKHDTFMRLLKQEDWVCRIYGDNARPACIGRTGSEVEGRRGGRAGERAAY